MKDNKLIKAAKAAFPNTIPILTGFLFLGAAYGVLMRSLGFPVYLPIITSIFIYAGSMEFVTANLLTLSFSPITAFFMTLMVNARHIFYGLSMLDKYKNTGKKKLYLIFGLTDETFSINYSADIPDGVDKSWYQFFVTMFNQIYWVGSVTIGALFGNLISFDLTGIDFVMTALVIVIFVNQFQKEKDHFPSFCGLAVSVLCLIIFGADSFIIPSMLGILAVLSAAKVPLEKKAGDGR